MSRQIKFSMFVEVSVVVDDDCYPNGIEDDEIADIEMANLSADPAMYLDMALSEQGAGQPVGSVKFGVEVKEHRDD